MSARVTTALLDDGRVVACKPAAAAPEVERLRHEAEILTAARHPGVVELVDCEADGSGTTLRTAFVGTHSLATAPPPTTVERAAALVASLADTVAGLHEVGIVHGRIEPSHVLLGPKGRPILCGFAGGGRVGTTPPPGSLAQPEFVDPATAETPILAKANDVHGLGALLRHLVTRAGAPSTGVIDDADPIPERRLGLRSRSGWTGYRRRALLNLADHATDPVPTRRPTAQRFAADIHALVPGARLDGTRGASTDEFEPLRTVDDEPVNRRWVGALGTALGIVLVVAGITAFHRDHPATAERATAADPPATATTVDAPTPSAPAPARACPQPGPVTGGDVDGDGCPDALSAAADGTVSVGPRRFQIGEAGDRVVLGDWDCDGVTTAALVRPSTGAVFVFERWPDASGTLDAAPVAHVPGAVDATVQASPDGCATLVVRHGDGTTEEIRP